MYTLLVPTDFTEAADCALDHANKIAELFQGEVQLLHVVAKDKEIPKIEEKLDKIISERGIAGVKYNKIVRKGNIFDDIGDVAKDIGANIILMGTHGVKGIQKLVGSYALKVILHSEVPFIITQKKGPVHDGYKNVVVPINYEQETKQKLVLIAAIAKHFDATLHVYVPNESDAFLKARLKNQLGFTRKFLDEKKVKYDVKIAEQKGDFNMQVASYAKKIGSDLIAVINTADKGVLPDFMGGSSGEQDLITNSEQIPVIIMNPSQKFVAESFG